MVGRRVLFFSFIGLVGLGLAAIFLTLENSSKQSSLKHHSQKSDPMPVKTAEGFDVPALLKAESPDNPKRLAKIANQLEASDWQKLAESAVEQTLSFRERYLAVYILTLVAKSGVAEHLLRIASEPVSNFTVGSAEYQNELLIRSQALVGASHSLPVPRRELERFAKSQPNAFLAGLARRLSRSP